MTKQFSCTCCGCAMCMVGEDTLYKGEILIVRIHCPYSPMTAFKFYAYIHCQCIVMNPTTFLMLFFKLLFTWNLTVLIQTSLSLCKRSCMNFVKRIVIVSSGFMYESKGFYSCPDSHISLQTIFHTYQHSKL